MNLQEQAEFYEAIVGPLCDPQDVLHMSRHDLEQQVSELMSAEQAASMSPAAAAQIILDEATSLAAE